jgi:tripartite-type tricarboxylate transporter receptor subunit TctC
MANEAQFYFGPIAGMVPFIEAGSVKALAVSGDARSPSLPDVPTMAEAGYPDVNAIFWSGVFAPAGTPPDIVAKLQTTLAQTIHDGGVVAKLKTLAVRPSYASPEQFKRMIDEEIEEYREVVQAAHLHFED